MRLDCKHMGVHELRRRHLEAVRRSNEARASMNQAEKDVLALACELINRGLTPMKFD